MLTLTKFICGCFGIGALAILGTSLVQAPGNSSQSVAHGSSLSTGDALMQTASAQVDSIARQASAELGPRLRSLSANGGVFVRSNATSARLQLEGMANGLSFYLSADAWRHGETPYWIRTGVRGAVQTSGEKTIAMARNMTIVRACKSNMEHLADLGPSLSGAGSNF
ncbi:MAG TPA: hypothetical protein VGG56_02295 [Terracidiphilus sp.]|jgi:hypothetical protein